MDFELLQKNLKHLRLNIDMSQEALAAALCMARSTYSAYETGAKIPDLYSLKVMASFYDISPDILLFCDLSESPFDCIYSASADDELAQLIKNYQSLSITDKNIVSERLDILMELS